MSSHNASEAQKSVHAWISGKEHFITQEALIAKGGFGEVHKVSFPMAFTEQSYVDEERKNGTGRRAVRQLANITRRYSRER